MAEPMVGTSWGRWTVVRACAPAQRYGEPFARQRVMVRCRCGTERAVFVVDLQAGKTAGCRVCVARCRAADVVLGQLARTQGPPLVRDLLVHLEAATEAWIGEAHHGG